MATPVNVLQPVDTEIDPFASASEPEVISVNYDLFGLVEIQASAVHLQTGVGKVPYDPTNTSHKRMTAVNVYIQPLAEIEVKYPKQWECDWIAEFQTWAKVTLPSIKEAYSNFTGHEMGSVREINGKWARVARVDSLDKPFEKKDPITKQPTGEKAVKKTYKFIELYDSEEACRAAYLANGGKAAEAPAAPVADPANEEKTAATAFLKVIVQNACKGKKMTDDWKAAVKTALGGYPMVAKHFTEESPEVAELALPLLAA